MVIATSPVMRSTANPMDRRSARMASEKQATAIRTFDWMVKKANTLSPRSQGTLKNQPVPLAATGTWIASPATTANPVTVNHARAHGRLSDLRSRSTS